MEHSPCVMLVKVLAYETRLSIHSEYCCVLVNLLNFLRDVTKLTIFTISVFSYHVQFFLISIRLIVIQISYSYSLQYIQKTFCNQI